MFEKTHFPDIQTQLLHAHAIYAFDQIGPAAKIWREKTFHQTAQNLITWAE